MHWLPWCTRCIEIPHFFHISPNAWMLHGNRLPFPYSNVADRNVPKIPFLPWRRDESWRCREKLRWLSFPTSQSCSSRNWQRMPSSSLWFWPLDLCKHNNFLFLEFIDRKPWVLGLKPEVPQQWHTRPNAMIGGGGVEARSRLSDQDVSWKRNHEDQFCAEKDDSDIFSSCISRNV